MAFIDDLTLILDLLVLVTVTVFYTGVFVWWHSRKNDLERAQSHLREGAFVLGGLGVVIGLVAMWGEFTWPLPGAYNLYFFDPLVLLAILLIAFCITVQRKLPTHFIGMIGAVIGAGVMYYGLRADYYLQLTKAPLETLLMYLAFGGMAILTLPMTIYIDWFVTGPTNPGTAPFRSDPKPAYPKLWWALFILFALAVFLSGLAALLYGFSSAWSHLSSPP